MRIVLKGGLALHRIKQKPVETNAATGVVVEINDVRDLSPIH